MDQPVTNTCHLKWSAWVWEVGLEVRHCLQSQHPFSEWCESWLPYPLQLPANAYPGGQQVVAQVVGFLYPFGRP